MNLGALNNSCFLFSLAGNSVDKAKSCENILFLKFRHHMNSNYMVKICLHAAGRPAYSSSWELRVLSLNQLDGEKPRQMPSPTVSTHTRPRTLPLDTLWELWHRSRITREVVCPPGKASCAFH